MTAILGCQLDYPGMNFNLEMEGKPVSPILKHEDNVPLVWILTLES